MFPGKSTELGVSRGEEENKGDSAFSLTRRGGGVSTTDEKLNESGNRRRKARPTRRNEIANFTKT